MLNLISLMTNAVLSATTDIKMGVRRRLIERRFDAAKKAITSAKAAHISKAENISSKDSYDDVLSVTWQDVLNLGAPFKARHESRLEDLEARIVDNIDETGEWFTEPDPETADKLQKQRVPKLRDRAGADLSAILNKSLKMAQDKFVTECAKITERVEGHERTNLQALAADKGVELAKFAQDDAARDEARGLLDDAKQGWEKRVKTSYRNMLKKKLEEFDNNERPHLIASVERNRTAAHWIKKLLLEGESVQNAKLSGMYQLGDQHLQDQLINTVTLTVMENGELAYTARERGGGGRFSFEKNYMAPSKKFLKQAENEPPDLEAKGTENKEPPFALRFLDQVQIPATSSALLTKDAYFDLGVGDNVERILLQFAGDVQPVPLDTDESRFRDLPYINNYPGTQFVTDWLKRGVARQISVALRPNGLLAVVIKLTDRKALSDNDVPDNVIRVRTRYNEARLMSLLIVALVTRVLNGSGNERGFPVQCDESPRLYIPSFCVWPLQVDPKGAVTQAKTILEQLDQGKLAQDDVPRWAVGWSPALHGDGALVDALGARFTHSAERHLRVLNSTDAGPMVVRKGVNEHDALSKLTRWFKHSSLVLGALWSVAVLSTLLAANAYTEKELWTITLVFSLIGIWRCLVCWGLSARAREPVVPVVPTGILSRLAKAVSGIVGTMIELAFARRWFLLTGPVVLACVMVAAFRLPDLLNTLWEQLGAPEELVAAVSEEAAKKDFGLFGNDGAPATGFQASLYKGVWALPLLAIGLMRHGYMLLYDLVLQRGQLQRKLNSVVGVQETWAAGRNLPSLKSETEANTPALAPDRVKAITAALEQMKARVTQDIAAARSRFDKGSAANAALVAVIGLLAPFSQMSAAKLVPSEQNDYQGLSAELEKTHPALVQALRPLVPLWDPSTVTKVEITPEVLADLGALNKELGAMLETLNHIQKNRDVTITARTEEAHRHLGAFSASIERLQPAPLVIGANTKPVDDALTVLMQEIKQTQLPTLNIPLDLQQETAPWIDVDLAFFGEFERREGPSQIMPDALAHCDKLGGMHFEDGEWEINKGVWFSVAGEVDTPITKGGAALDALISRAQALQANGGAALEETKRLYVLGLADARGNAAANLELSKRRADAVKDVLSRQVAGFAMVALPLGEAGWLTGAGLPDNESDKNHRSATVYMCPKPVLLAGDEEGGDTQ